MMNSIELFDYDLPSNLIATKPRPKREQAKLMIYNKKLEMKLLILYSPLVII